MKFRPEKVVDVDEWDKLVSETYGRPYTFQQQDGCKDRGTYTLTVPDSYDWESEALDDVSEDSDEEYPTAVKFEKWLSRDPKQSLQNQEYEWELSLWWERQFYPYIETVANDLHKRGLLEAGEYLIVIDW